MSVNKAILVGNLGKDPELRYTPQGTAVCNFSIATTEKRKEETFTTWHNIVAWANLAEICGKYLVKGKQVYVEGRIDNRTYDKSDGTKGYTSEVVIYTMQMLGSKGEGQSNQQDSDVPF